MGSGFTYNDAITLPTNKADGSKPSVPSEWVAADANLTNAAALDLRTSLRYGQYHGNVDQSGGLPAAPSPGASLWTSIAGMPKWALGNGDTNNPAFASAYDKRWNATDFVQSGDTSFSQALNRAIINATAAGGGEVYVPRGSYNLDTKVLIAAAVGVRIVGAGQNATKFTWTGATTDPVFQMRNCQYCFLRECSISGNATNRPDAGLSILEDTGSAGLGSTACGAANVIIGADGIANNLKYGIRIHYAASDIDNSEHRFWHVDMLAAGAAAVSIEGTQSKAHDFFSCSANNTNAGVSTAQGPSGFGGNFNWWGGSIGNQNFAAFYLGSPNDPINIVGVGSEGCSRFLSTSSNNGSAWQVKILGCRVDTNNLNADRDLIIWGCIAGLTVEGNVFGSGTTLAARPRINWNCTTAGGSLALKRNAFLNTTHLTAPEDPIHLSSAYGKVDREGNTYLNGGIGACVRAFDGDVALGNIQVGTSYAALQGDQIIFMSNDATRTATLPSTPQIGQRITVQDTSGSVTVGHTITISPAAGNIDGGASTVITPGTNKSKTMVYDGTAWWVTAVR